MNFGTSRRGTTAAIVETVRSNQGEARQRGLQHQRPAHRDAPLALAETIGELVGDGITGSAAPRRCGISPLDDKSGCDSVKDRSVEDLVVNVDLNPVPTLAFEFCVPPNPVVPRPAT